MARSLYREWFVNFRFPGHEKVPRVASPLGDDSQRLGGEIHSAILDGSSPEKHPAKPTRISTVRIYRFVKTPDMHGNHAHRSARATVSRQRAQNSQANKTLPAGSICVSCIGTIGVVSITTEDCQTNQQINSVALGEPGEPGVSVFFVSRTRSQALENLGANGATMGNVNKGKFEAMEIAPPADDLLTRYHRLVEPMFSADSQPAPPNPKPPADA